MDVGGRAGRMSGAGVRSAFLVVVGFMNIILAGVALAFTDQGLNPVQVIAGPAMLAAGLFLHARSKRHPVARSGTTSRAPVLPRVLLALVIGAGIVWVKVEFLQESPPDESSARAIDKAYPYLGEGDGGMRVGLYSEGERVAWRVNSAGTDNCRPAGTTALWNFASGTTDVDAQGRFHARRKYYAPDRGLNGAQYEKEVVYRLRGRFARDGQARGSFWRRDRYYQVNALQFTCLRSGRWTAALR